MPCVAGTGREPALDRHRIEKETSTPATLVSGLQSFSWLLVGARTHSVKESRVDLIVPHDGSEWIIREVIDGASSFQVLVHDSAHVTRQNVAVDYPFGKDLHHRRPEAMTEARRCIDVNTVTHLLPLDLLLQFGQNASALLVGARRSDAHEDPPRPTFLIPVVGLGHSRTVSLLVCIALGSR